MCLFLDTACTNTVHNSTVPEQYLFLKIALNFTDFFLMNERLNVYSTVHFVSFAKSISKINRIYEQNSEAPNRGNKDCI